MTRPIIFYANNILFFTFISLLRTFIDLSIHLSGGLLFNIILLLLKIFDALYLLESCVARHQVPRAISIGQIIFWYRLCVSYCLHIRLQDFHVLFYDQYTFWIHCWLYHPRTFILPSWLLPLWPNRLTPRDGREKMEWH